MAYTISLPPCEAFGSTVRPGAGVGQLSKAAVKPLCVTVDFPVAPVAGARNRCCTAGARAIGAATTSRGFGGVATGRTRSTLLSRWLGGRLTS